MLINRQNKHQGINMNPPALSSLTTSSWGSVSGWRWPRACGRSAQSPGGLKVSGARWRPALNHLCPEERRGPAFARERTRGWRGEGGCRLEAAWCSYPLSEWDSTNGGIPEKEGGGRCYKGSRSKLISPRYKTSTGYENALLARCK